LRHASLRQKKMMIFFDGLENRERANFTRNEMKKEKGKRER
jgi:hypothetical protein